MPAPGSIPALRVPPAETQVDGLPPALSFDSDLNVPFAQRRSVCSKIKPYELLKQVFYSRYDHQPSNAVPRSSFYKILGVESVGPLNFQHVKISKPHKYILRLPVDP